jgi:hypothetical protein
MTRRQCPALAESLAEARATVARLEALHHEINEIAGESNPAIDAMLGLLRDQVDRAEAGDLAGAYDALERFNRLAAGVPVNP